MTISDFLGRKSRQLLLACLPLLIPFAVVADETEIFFQNDDSLASPNVLFILDASASMDVLMPDGSGRTRMEGVKDAFREVMSQVPSDIRVGLMGYANADRFASYRWSSIKGVGFPVSDIDDDASEVIGAFSGVDNLPDPESGMPVRMFLSTVVDSWTHSGYTPIVDSLYEAARYFRGEGVVWGKYPPAYKWAAHPSTYTGSVSCQNPTQEFCLPISDSSPCNGTEDESQCTDIWVNDCCRDENGECITGAGSTDLGCGFWSGLCTHTVCSDGVSGTAAYNSPIEQSCQSNYLVLMSDGKPEYPFWTAETEDGTGRYSKSAFPDWAHDTAIMPTLVPEIDGSVITEAIPAMIGTSCADQPQGYASGTCGPELTRFLADVDQISTLEGEQTVKTYTVAFGLGDEPNGTAYMAALATAEDGAYTAENAAELAEAFKKIFSDIGRKSLSFSSPSFTVSDDNVLSHSGSVYMPVFDSNRTPLWSGNLRKFQLNSDGNIVGATGAEVLTDGATFRESAQGLWSTEAHGTDVKRGGAASLIPAPENRKLWTDALGNGSPISIDASEADITAEMLSGAARTTPNNLVDAAQDGMSSFGWYEDCAGNIVAVGDYSELIDEDIAVPGPVDIEAVTTCGTTINADRREILLNFVRGHTDGVVTTGDPGRKHMGDMLNTRPVVAHYANKSLVLAATNEGYIHAINADTGVEEWAFMPVSLLKNIDAFYRNDEDKRHVYGLDGNLTLWKHDANEDGQFDLSSGDKLYLFFGMRRGGRMYYALDITNADTNYKPKLEWKIGPQDGTGFGQLGETWSRPTRSKMRFAATGSQTGDVKDVLVFGGGYDPVKDNQDYTGASASGELGSDIYIVDALTGNLLWSLKGSPLADGSASAASVVDSIPGDIRILDMDNNGELDRMYFADTGGHVWRLDFGLSIQGSGSTAAVSTSASLSMLADLDDGTRKFFYEPDTALRLADGKPVLTVSLGSGYRTHPLATSDDDHFFVLIDEHAYKAVPENTAAITISDLMDVQALRSSGKSILQNEKKGWYYEFSHKGEKVLASSVTFLDKVIFTTFAMVDEDGHENAVSACSSVVNTSRAYVLDLMTGKPVADLDRTVDSSKDEFLVTGINEILDAPQLVFSELQSGDGSACSAGDCQQSVSVRIGKLDLPLLDLSNTNNEANAAYSEMVDVTKLLPRLYWRDDNLSGNEHGLEGSSSIAEP